MMIFFILSKALINECNDINFGVFFFDWEKILIKNKTFCEENKKWTQIRTNFWMNKKIIEQFLLLKDKKKQNI